VSRVASPRGTWVNGLLDDSGARRPSRSAAASSKVIGRVTIDVSVRVSRMRRSSHPIGAAGSCWAWFDASPKRAFWIDWLAGAVFVGII